MRLNQKKLAELISAYKADFIVRWEDERYKWEAALHFKKHWDIHAPNFLEMFMEATDKTYHLLARKNHYPRGMVQAFAKADAEAVREMFLRLFDQSAGLAERIGQFQAAAEGLRARYDDGSWRRHYQGESAVTAYLWLNNPDQYYIYDDSEAMALARALESEFIPKKGGGAQNVEGGFLLYDEARAAIKRDAELRGILEGALRESCYPDPEMVTMTVDLVSFASHFYGQEDGELKAAPGQADVRKAIICAGGGEAGQKKAPYTREDFLSQVYMTKEQHESLTALLKHKKNIILQGAPGVGKTFCAKRLAYSMMGEKDDGRIEFVQFHQNYSYEDFIMGYKPCGEGFQLTDGIFYRFCIQAAKQPDKDYFFLIDEINRGNLSKIFGELLMLIERDYRGEKATLAYNGKAFSVPKNLYLIGMMNTADRSLALIDYALRRRFGFYEMEPGFHSEGFQAYQASLKNKTFDALIRQVIELNKEIKNDDALGGGFQIGHSYFCGQKRCDEGWMKSVVRYDIIPTLKEYWFDDRQSVQRWENNLIGVFHD